VLQRMQNGFGIPLQTLARLVRSEQTGPYESECHASLAARGFRKELTQRHEVGIVRVVDPSQSRNTRYEEGTQLSDGPTRRASPCSSGGRGGPLLPYCPPEKRSLSGMRQHVQAYESAQDVSCAHIIFQLDKADADENHHTIVIPFFRNLE
jgi:hypothetical protein